MARADLLCELIKYGLINDSVHFRKATEALCAEERSKQHTVLAAKIDELLKNSHKSIAKDNVISPTIIRGGTSEQSLFLEKTPRKRLDHLILPNNIKSICQDLITEQNRSDLLQSYGIEPRNKILLIGPPGNGKTSLAEAISEALMIPLLTVRYENIIGSYLGETASRLSRLFDYVKTRECVLFFDEFETLGKERGDTHETGEIKRVVSSLLMQIDALPSYVIVIAATNHDTLLDKAAWRRFQVRIEIPKPTRNNLEEYYRFFEKEKDFKFGLQPSTLARKTLGISYAEAEEFALSVYRQYILSLPNDNAKEITERAICSWQSQVIIAHKDQEGVGTCQTDL
ncbi:AAA family ATPase [Treponema denticola]|uniref:AAA family ATPase n=1 Tax=Treponema denticola TaxID=158 RepID=UPI0020A4521E|nr:ATP-binding protein [Treponema denticola]UTC88608.1 ATP-binding protein [Treponema denticola]